MEDPEALIAESRRRAPPRPGRTREPESCLHELFEASAARRPAAVALSFGELDVPYAELDRRAARLARRLRRLGVGPECLAGLCLERSVEMVVAILGVLKAGGAYLPLDPDYPEERLRFMWLDSRAAAPPGAPAVLLGLGRTAGRLERLAEGTGAEVVLLDGAPESGDETDRGPLPRAETGVGPRHLAYVIYTSGSTGRPKGVMIEHRSVVNVVRHAARALGVTPGSRVLQLASLSFDASVLETFTAFAAGARLVLTPRETLLSGEALGEELRRRGITTLAIPPSLLNRVPDGVSLPALRAIVVGGEACSAPTARRWAPGRAFVNAYAPTEATIYTTAAACAGPYDRPPAMGRPIPGTAARVLDAEGRPVPAGEVGELCLGGLGLARGYAGRPGLTAERFVPDALAGTAPAAPPGSRLYRSGDLGRRLPDGGLEFAGRADHQVKVRGLRIELGEIEAVLAACPGVRQAVVARREDLPGEPRLVGYVVPEPGARPPVGELRSFLAERLPEAMVPSAFVALDALPRTATGKIDRRALPVPGPERPDLSTAYAAPEGPIETALEAVWAAVLGLERVGVEDDLFELGGHSLVVAQIVNRVREEMGLEVPLLAVFEHPTVRALASWLATETDAGAARRLPPVEPAPRDRPIPVSFAQERVWFLLQLAPGSVAYDFQFSVRFRGDLSLPALAKALGELVRRHEVLRTTFPAVDGQPVQRTHPPFPARVPVVDLSAAPPAERERRLEDLVRAEVRWGFDVMRLPLLRWTLVRLAPDDHLLLQVEHHFVHDGWSLAVYLRELKELYAAYRAGGPSPLAEPPIQYADFAVWQRRWMQGEVLAEQLAYWRGKLGGSPPLLELPSDRPRPRVASFRGGCLRVDLDPELSRGVRAFGRRSGATLFMTMLAAFDTLLYRYTGQRDVVLGSGLANRRLRQAEGLVGMVVNTLLIRSALDGAMAFGELVDQVRRTTLELHRYQDLPFEKLVAELQPDRDLSRNPLFQVLFSFHDAPVPDLDLPGVTGELFEWHNGSAKTDLNVVVKPVAEQRVGRRASAEDAVLTMVWEYSGDLFDRATIERMWGHYRNLLAAVVAEPATPLDRLPLLSAAERQELLAEWNDTAAPYPRERSIPELFHEVARRRPDAVALRQGERWWSYGELERRSARVAARLAAEGAGPEALVGLAAERSPEMIAGLLGILEAGAGYLPLDPGYPAERLRFMLEDGRVPVLLAADELAGRLPAAPGGGPGPRVVSLEAAAAGEGPAGEAPTSGWSGPGSLAYVLYTSGSTGKPKGVAVEHRSVVRLVREASWAAMGEDEVFLQLAPVPFDASTLEIWGALLNGGRLELAPPGTPSLAELGRGIEASRVTTLWLTAGLFHQMVEAELPRLAGVRQLLAGGDVLSPLHVAQVRAALAPGQALINGYGPTEGTTFTCCHRMGPAPAAGAGEPGPGPPVPIGRPISSTRVYVLAPGVGGALEPVPPGVPGELFAGGDGVARGYLARPALTAAAFVPDPFGAPGARLYRTGDLVRWLPTGPVEFLGRIDGQVKLRGFRIELGEVEAALQELPEVAEAVVVARDGGQPAGAGADGAAAGGEDRRLVAYVVPRRPLDPDPAHLRRALEARLPEHMVPSDFVLLEALPLSPTGKVDRRALPEPRPAGADGGAGAPAVAPRTPTEELVAALWGQVLGVERVGVHDDFFDLGGHSLLATRLLSRLRTATRVEVPLVDLFDAPTVAGLARRVEALLRGAAGPADAGEESIPPRGDGGPAPLSFAQERLWFLDRLAPGDAAYNIARALRLEGDLDAAALRGALAAVARRHEVLRARFDDRGGRPVQVADLPTPRLPVVDLRGLAGRDRAEAVAAALGRAESRRVFDLARGPLVRATLLRLGRDRHVLLLTLHHAAADGWSMAILYRELGAAYRALAAGAPVELPPLLVQYADFAVWQRGHLAGERLERLLAFWRERLAGAPAAFELPLDRPRPRLESRRGAREALPLAPELPAAVAELAARRGATPFMVYLAGFAALLHRYTGRTDVVLGTPMANRAAAEVEGLIGFFTNSLVLRLDAGGDPGFDELLGRVREAVLRTHARQEVPFEKLVEELVPERDLSRAPLFQILFQVEDERPDELELAGLAVRRLDLARSETKFDLSLALSPGPDGLVAWAQFSVDLFDRTRMRRLLAHLGHLLEGALARPGLPLSGLPLLGPAERSQVLREWNDTDRPLRAPAAETPPVIPRLFEAQAIRTPDAVALSFEGAQLSFGALREAVGRWAVRLRALGVGPEAPVGVCVERSLEMMVGLLAVLEAGGAYVPLDPSYPAQRLAAMLEDCAAGVVLTLERLRHLLPAAPEGAARTVLCLDREPPEGPPAGPGTWELPTPENLAYVIFTSGSTGKPKGAMNAHRAVVNRLLWMRDEHGVGPGDRVLQKTPFGFDVSVWELFLPLITGARLVIARPDGHRDPAYLAGLVEREGITAVHFVPSMLQAFLGLPRLDGCGSLRRVFASGEALPAPLVGTFNRRLACELHNLYGPTEAAVEVSSWACPRQGEPETVPIGRPIANAHLYLVDGELQPAPIGVPGELVIGGLPPGRGYLRRPALTAERFVPDPLGAEPGRRLYRTGDLCRTQPSGEIEYLGRLDFQVKIRGHRIEIGEIEAALMAHAAVREAVVVARPGPPGAAGLTSLAAFVTAAGATVPRPAELQAHLRRTLPEPMIPSAVVVLDELPLSASGKADRGALSRRPLAAPGAPGDGEAPSRVLPRDPLERELARLWVEVLEVDEVGVDDDFFHLGGNSITGAMTINRLQALLGETVSVVALFDAPTVAGLARYVAQSHPVAAARVTAASAAVSTPRAAPGPAPGPALVRRPAAGSPTQIWAPASFSQERLWFLDRFDPGTAVYNVPAVFRFRGRLRAPVLARALGEVVRRHEALRTVFLEVDGRPLQEVRPASAAALPWIDLAALPAGAAAAEASRVARRSARQVFDLAAGPLWSAWLLRLSDREHRLAWCVHHIAADGWSLGILLRELTALYDAWSRGLPSPLAEPPVQYADFAAWQRRTLGAGALAEQLESWRRRLEGAPRALELPTDRPRPPQQTFRGERAARVVAPELLARLLALAAGEGATLFMLLLAALDTVLSRWTGQRDVLVGSPVAGRTRTETEGLVGMFLNTLVLRLELAGDGAGDPTFRELLRRAREAALDAYSHQDVPFEMVLEALGVERELSRTPLFQVFLNVTNFPRDRVPLAGLEVEVLDGEEAPGSKFDLTLYAGPGGGGLALKLVYNADLFDRARMEELLDQLMGLLDRVGADPDRAFTEYTLRTPAAAALLPDPAQALSDRWQGAVHEVFTARAAEAPERVAVTGPGVAWTYGALDRATDRLARALAAAGVGRGDRAVIYAERSPSLPLAVLGVLRAGAAFVVLDPAHPPRHLVEIAERSRPRAVVRLAEAGPVPEALAQALARLAPAIDLELPRPGAGPPEGGPLAEWRAPDPDRPPPLAIVGRDDLACIAFTSGTTGKPKGILGRHGPLSHFIPWQRRRLGLGPDDRYSMLSGLAHDPLQRDMFTPLQTGATLCVPPPDDVLRPARLLAWMACERVSVAHLTPAMGQLLVNGAAEGKGEEEGLPALRRAFLVGEQLSAVLVDELARLAPRLACFNFYGTTETQRAVGCYPVPPNAARRFRTGIPLGHGIEDVQLLVLGASGGLAGVAELGEIALRSPHLARGYLDDPGLTAERFTPDPFGAGTLAGGRIYRTGDLGRYRPDGAVELTTRADDQVQVRGFRVELGAIETALAEHPAVAEAAVAARPGPDGTYLVGYLVPAAGAAPAAEELRSHLAERLPGYMVPGVFVTLDALPLTRTAKVDRRALPDPGSALVVAADFEPASSPVEELLAEIWRDLLRVERVGAGDDFFALGGHSLLATRVVSRLRLEVDLELPLRTLFERPRLRDLAEAVEELLLAGETEELAGVP